MTSAKLTDFGVPGSLDEEQARLFCDKFNIILKKPDASRAPLDELFSLTLDYSP